MVWVGGVERGTGCSTAPSRQRTGVGTRWQYATYDGQGGFAAGVIGGGNIAGGGESGGDTLVLLHARCVGGLSLEQPLGLALHENGQSHFNLATLPARYGPAEDIAN